MGRRRYSLPSHVPLSGETVAGVDEAGRGCLAGPVVAAAVVMPGPFRIKGLNDSKQVAPEERERLAATVRERCLAWAVGMVWPARIDEINILQASLLAMAKAVKSLKADPRILLIDGNQKSPYLTREQHTVVDGDALIPLISAASIMAKTVRDRLLVKLDRLYPGYGLAGHKGYATKKHREALRELGPCRLHRLSFRGVSPDKEQGLWLPGI